MASWCTYFPVKEDWGPSQFNDFVSYFQKLRTETFGGHLDGIDFDWEGYCDETCLKEVCTCDWDDKICGDHTPEELAAGVYWYVDDAKGKPQRFMCWMMPTKHTL